MKIFNSELTCRRTPRKVFYTQGGGKIVKEAKVQALKDFYDDLKVEKSKEIKIKPFHRTCGVGASRQERENRLAKLERHDVEKQGYVLSNQWV